MKSNFVGKVVIVTGSTSGIGEATVKLFAEYGANCVVTGRNAERVDKVVAACEKLSPYKCKHLGVVADITKEEDAKSLMEQTIAKFGRLDVLVNNAGGALLTPIMDPNSIVNFDKLHALDVRSIVFLTLQAVPHLVKTKGNIVNISSICANRPFKLFYAYCMAKASIDMFTKTICLELGEKGVRVNSINSGGVKTRFFNAAGMDDVQKSAQEDIIKACSPLNLIGEPEDIAKLTTYIASPDAEFITGSNITIDGGQCLTSSLKLLGT